VQVRSAIGLIFIPMFAATLTGVIAGIIGVAEFRIRKGNAVANQGIQRTK